MQADRELFFVIFLINDLIKQSEILKLTTFCKPNQAGILLTSMICNEPFLSSIRSTPA